MTIRFSIKVCFLIVVKLIFFPHSGMAQKEINSSATITISGPEKRWALFHPCAAKKIYRAAKAALDGVRKVRTDSLLDNRNSGGTLDAFRHAYWMALASQKVRTKKALRFGEAHERGNYKMYKKLQYEEGEVPDSVSSAMDLFNNKVGAITGCENKLMSQDQLMQLIISKIKAGEMKIIAIDCKGNYIDCNHEPVDLKKIRHKWVNSKCLIPSDSGCFSEN